VSLRLTTCGLPSDLFTKILKFELSVNPCYFWTNHTMFVETNFTDYDNDCDYVVRYDNEHNYVTIRVIDNVEFYQWSKIISTDFRSKSGQTTVLTPQTIYKIFDDYGQGDLSNNYKIVLPKTYDCDKTIEIKIHFKTEYQDDYDIRILTLEPIDISPENRFQAKIEQLNQQLDLKNAKINELQTYTLVLEQVNQTLRSNSSSNDDSDSIDDNDILHVPNEETLSMKLESIIDFLFCCGNP